MSYTRDNTIVLFDVDGTLTKPRNGALPDIKETLAALQKRVSVGVVGGSDLSKIREQLGEKVETEYDYLFSENGLVAYEGGKVLAVTTIKGFLGEDRLKKFINFVLAYLAQVDIPIKRGTFIEFRNGMLNVSPIGRNCSQEERDAFWEYDKIHNVRAKMVEVLQRQFPDYGLKYSIGGQISFDVFPEGWDKTFCLRYLEKFQNVFFYGDKTMPGGNDYEIFSHPKVKGTTVTGPDHTKSLITQQFLQ